MNFKIESSSGNVSIRPICNVGGIELFELKAVYDTEQIPERLSLTFSVPDLDIYSIWSPSLRYDRHLAPSWATRTTASRLASWMPLHALVSNDGMNRMTLAVSDAKTPIAISAGVCDDDARVYWDVSFFTLKVAPLREYKAILRIDTRNIPYYDAIYDVIEWWEKDCGYGPAYVPEYARLPMNSLWYSYHQELDVEDIIKECELSKAMGMDTVIIDDGWQTDDNNRGYQFCGDWKVAPSKIPDMKRFVDGIHATGMKVMLWFSVPFVGKSTEAYQRFSDMLLDETGDKTTYWALDPRYKEARQYLVGIYADALKNWGLDGVKLDFIDSFSLKGSSLEYDERRDYQSLEDAIDVLMTDVTDTLRAIDPEVLIEFRQSYIGPAIRKYGNMLRVGDCPNDAIRNRQDVVNLRLTSGKTAVHSDMLMWNREDSVESAALQFASVLYGVPQVSMKIATLSEEHRKMLKYYLSFWRENRALLIDGKLIAANPECAYSLVCSEKDGNAIFTSYTDTVIDCSAYHEIIAVNCSRAKSLILKGAEGKSYRVVNCMGEVLSEGIVDSRIFEVKVTMAGMVFVK